MTDSLLQKIDAMIAEATDSYEEFGGSDVGIHAEVRRNTLVQVRALIQADREEMIKRLESLRSEESSPPACGAYEQAISILKGEEV